MVGRIFCVFLEIVKFENVGPINEGILEDKEVVGDPYFTIFWDARCL